MSQNINSTTRNYLDRKCARFSVAARSHEIFKNKVPERMNMNKYEPTNYFKQSAKLLNYTSF